MTHAQEKNNKRKVVLIIAAILVAIGIITGGISAFFSDFVTGNSTITAGTLDLVKGTETITQNGTAITSIGNNNAIVENFNPGDVVTVSVPVTNSGSKSAHLRGKLIIRRKHYFLILHLFLIVFTVNLVIVMSSTKNIMRLMQLIFRWEKKHI